MTSSFLDVQPHLSFTEQPRLLRGVFSILLTSTVITVFEISFFVAIVAPKTKRSVEVLNQRLSTFGLIPSGLNGRQSSLVLAGLKTNAKAEKELMDLANTYALASSCVFVAFLCVLLLLLSNRMARLGHNRARVRYFGVDFDATMITSVLMISSLMAFQVTFYFFGTKFEFEGSRGDAELQHALNNELRRKKGLAPIAPL